MKKYVTLNKDLSDLVNEVNSYIATKVAASPAYKIQLFHVLEGYGEELYSIAPSCETAFSDENLTVMRLAHYSIDNMVRVVPVKFSCLLVPLKDCDQSKLNLNVIKPNSVTRIDYLTDSEYYDINDCDTIETISTFDNPILLPNGNLISFKNDGNELAQFLFIAFNEDISDYFAE